MSGIPGYVTKAEVRKSEHSGRWYYRCPCGSGAGGYASQQVAWNVLVSVHLLLSHGVGRKKR